MINHFSHQEFEGIIHIKDADLQKMAKLLADVNVKECPYFDLSDKYGNSARYYRENQWIPCIERLPEPVKTYYLVTTDFGEIDIAYWLVDGWCTFSDNQVVAWMPLPEPYKGDEE